MRVAIAAATVASLLLVGPTPTAQAPRTLVAVWAHADDEGPVGPILARYAREGVQVHMIIATDGAQGAANTSVPRGPEIAKLRVEEARCSAQALGVQPPLLGCHKTQFSDEAVARTTKAMEEVWKGELPLSPMVPQPNATDVFQ